VTASSTGRGKIRVAGGALAGLLVLVAGAAAGVRSRTPARKRMTRRPVYDQLREKGPNRNE
jgi:hypothetical protein